MAMRVLLFDGQGSLPTSSSPCVQHLRSPLAALFVRQSRAAFNARVSSLTPAARPALNDRATRNLLSRIDEGSIILPSSDATLLHHPLIALPSLYITQVTRLLEELEMNGPLAKGTSVDVIGYSSGILPALLVATSLPSPSMADASLPTSSQLELLRNALALFEVAVSIGLEAQIAKECMLREGGISPDDPEYESEWSSVVLGEQRDTLEAKLASWNSQRKVPFHVHLTAQTTKTCHTVSGLPSSLREFISCTLLSSISHTSDCASASQNSLLSSPSSSSPPLCDAPLSSISQYFQRSITSSTTKPLGIFALFHAINPHLHGARDRVLASFFPCSQGNNASSPSSTDTPDASVYLNSHLNIPGFIVAGKDTITVLNSLRLVEGFTLYNVHTGCTVPGDLVGNKLIELAVNSIILDSIELSKTLETCAKRALPNMKMDIVNFGPGTGIARAAMRNLKDVMSSGIFLIDATAPRTATSFSKDTAASANLSSQEPIAIVGMAVNFPGAHNASELWHVLEQGLNTVEEIPETRFTITPYNNANPNTNPGRQLKTRFGNFLPSDLHASFDNAFFRISPREARVLDPQIRVLMRVGLQAMEAAGLVVQDFATNPKELGDGEIRSEDVGCFVGVATNDYVHNLRNDIGIHYATGTLPAFLAGRLAYALHLSGPSIVLDTACSSSLVAIHQACRAILAGDCKAALAGGVNVISSPDMYLGLDRAHFLSPTGNCKPWDATADGYCRAEGSGIFVLKRLSDALESSDNILGVIRGTEVNQSASAVSITRPHGPTQTALFRSLLDNAGVCPEEVSVVEAHGTGTQAGDPEELKSLRDVFSPNTGSGRDSSNMLTVTSIKGNIGHAEAASGAASLAKLLLMLRHNSIPSQVGLVTLNPKIEPLEKDFTRINTSGMCIKWTPSSTSRRIAVINNFGAAGSNAAILIEEAPVRTISTSLHSCAKGRSDHLIVGLSAETEDALLRLRDSYIASIDDATIVDFGYTATARRKLRSWRIAVTGDCKSSLIKALSESCPTRVTRASTQDKKIVFAFSGQGGQYIGMGRQLYTVSFSFRQIVNDCHEKLVNWGYPGVLAIVDTECDSQLPKNDEIIAFQCAMFVVECALCNMWENWGVKPHAVVGHSLGEYAALVAAGVLSLDDGLRLVGHRARLMTQGCRQNASGMLAARISGPGASEMLAKLDGCDGLSIACYNGPYDVVIGGPYSQLEVLKAKSDLYGVKCTNVSVPFAYHTAAMEPILEDMSSFARKFDFASPKIPIVSNVTGKVVQPGDATVFNSEYLSRHCREAVRFEEGARSLVDEFGDIGAFIEIGPHPTTLPLFAHLASTSGALVLHSLNKKSTARSSLCSALTRLFCFQDNIAWGKVYHDLYPSATCMEIPSYPLHETEFWVPFVEERSQASSPIHVEDPLRRFFFLSSWTQMPSTKDANTSEFETPINRLAEYITGHNVASSPLCPASVYHELALSAATCTLEHVDKSFADALTLSEVQFTLPLVYDHSNPVTIRTSINVHPGRSKHAGSFSISSVSDGREQIVHCTGFFQRRQKDSMISKLQLHHGTVERGKAALLSSENGVSRETLRTRTIYELIFSRVVQYSKLYQVINAMTLGEANSEGFATFRLSSDQASKGFVAQPVFVDALLHSAGFLINSRAAGNDAYICNQVDASKILVDLDYSATFEVYCTMISAGEGLMLADAWAVQTGELPRIVAHMKRMRFSRVRLSSLSRHLSRSEDIPSRNSTPAPFLRSSFERCASPVTPAKLGSPFRPAHRVMTPSSVSVSTASHADFDAASEVTGLIADLCDVPVAHITLDNNIADLGVDSLVWIELFGRLKAAFPGLPVDTSDLMLSATVGEVVSKFAKAHHRCVLQLDSPKTHSSFSKPAILSTPLTNGPVVIPHESSSTVAIIKEILAKVLDISACDLRNEDYLDTLGLDSLGSIEATSQLQEKFDVSLPHDFFIDCPTVCSVQLAIERIVSQRSHSRQSSSSTLVEPEPLQKFLGPKHTLLPLQTSANNASPLFLVHDGSGLGHCYSRIGALDRSLWGISNPKVLSGEGWKGGIPEMAAHYVSEVRPMVSDKGCILGGWSFGGIVAFHMACELMRTGVRVAGVVLIDSPSPFTRNPLPQSLINSVICPSSGSSKQQSRLIELARTQMSHATEALVAYDASANRPSQYPNVAMLRCIDTFPLSDMRMNFPLEPMPFLEDRSNPRTSVNDWERLVGKEVRIFDIPGHHFEPFSTKNVSALTQQLKNAIAYITSSNNSL
nr:ShPKS5 polyketide synthase 5 [Sanghuangporus sanghuang]